MSPFSSSATPDPIARELEADEHVLWWGCPDPGAIRKKTIPGALFSVIGGFCLLALVLSMGEPMWTAVAAGKAPDVFSAGFLIVFLAMTGMLFFRVFAPWTEAAKARSTFYALTNLRGLIVVEGRKKDVTSVWVPQFEIKRRGKGRGGDVILCTEVGGEDSPLIKIGFFGIENPLEVERMARELQQTTSMFTDQGS